MKSWVKGGLIGFVIFFVGLWIFLLATGHDPEGWRCASVGDAFYCSFSSFISSYVHWGFVIFFSFVGFVGGAVDSNIFRKIVYNPHLSQQMKYLKVTSTIVLTLIIVIGIVGVLAFENWIETMIYIILFAIFAEAVAWFIGKKRYGV